MTRDNAHQYLKKVYLTTKNDSFREALSVALAALRGPTREMVERMFPGCDTCRPRCGTCEISYAWDRYGKPNQCADCKDNGYKNYISESRFCEGCGKPLTDEAVEMVMERMETIR